MEFNFTEEQVGILLRLVRTEMSGFCGDVGYEELSKIRKILEEQLDNEEPSN
ncbi:hypothetical protein LRP52_34250 [Photobacterium sp. ZSDE20]|uniref:Uncharacterized protein n=1 Tax=Photobacterium pectinilyticum TaxID=2906793 RepID=A0ABT1N5R2_9GAMM|nr:hypothetical protein [Photobacterium sp. ZSDE20]MCQ1060070.1 hypothetical protein [Photobacterium sp. ZSDE20]MDD1827250.1 hypothetical protein [Photobacterium sp. ZSDE20]